VQSHVLVSGYRKGEPFCDGLAELWFDDVAALRAARYSDPFSAARAAEKELRDPARGGGLLTVEHVVKNGAVSAHGVKNVEFVLRRPDLSIEDFGRYWREHHGPLAARIAPIRRYVQSHAIDAPGEDRAFDGIASTWFDDTDAMRASAASEEYRLTREDEPRFVSVPLPFVITREHVLLAPPAP
jgi:uncharacterized protein (TIGR02118 family)